MSKIDQAVEIIRNNPEASRKDLIARFCKDLGMTPAGASTYVANARKKISKSNPVVKSVQVAITPKEKSNQERIATKKLAVVESSLKLKRPAKSLHPRIVDVIEKMDDKEVQARIKKMVELADAVN